LRNRRLEAMTKAEYLEKLQEKLERFGQELQADIMEDYKQHFAEGENEGKSEEEIIEELGNIEDMIRELSEEELQENINENLGWKQEMKIGLEKIVQSMPEAGSEISESLKKFVQKMPGVQFYQSSGQDESWEKNQERNQDGSREPGGSKTEGTEYAESSEGCRALVLDGEVADIAIEASEDDRIHVQYRNESKGKNKSRYQFYQYEEGNVFYAGLKRDERANEDEERGRKENFRMTLFGTTIISYGNVTNFNNGNCEISMHVKVPQDMRRIEVKSKSGDVSISDISSDSLHVNNASGDLKLSSVNVNSLEARMASGDVEIKEGDMKEVRISTASGDIEAEGMSVDRGDFSAASGDISLNGARVLTASCGTGSGDVELRNGYFRTIECHTGSGDIDLHTTAEEYECKAGSGDISIKAETEPKCVTMHTGSGDVDLELNGMEGMEATVGTMGGDIDIRWKEEHRREVKRGTYTFGAGGCRVNAKSGSGDIQIKAR